MKKFSKLKTFGLVFILTGALIFIGINFLEAKKPPEVQWEVTIPTLNEALTSGYNLYGTNGGSYVDDDTYVKVSVEKRRGKDPYYLFKLKLYNWDGTTCLPGDVYPKPGEFTIGFQGIVLNPEVEYPDEGPCGFPVCSELGEPSCMECFLNNYEHPSSWACVWCETHERLENRGYQRVYLQIKVFDDIENIEGTGNTVRTGLYMAVSTRIILADGQDYWHDIEIHRPGDYDLFATVDRVNEDSWKMTWGFQETKIVFEETYMEFVGEVKPKGKSGRSHYHYEEYTPMIATADQFSFQTTWTRTKVK